MNISKWLLLGGLIISSSWTPSIKGQSAPLTNVVSGVGGINADWIINGQNDPALTLVRGVTYVFQVFNSGGFHPFFVKTNSSVGGNNLYNNGVTGQGASGNNLVFAVPTNAPNQLIYQCGTHIAMMGFLNMTNAPSFAPNVIIISLLVTDTGVTVLSSGATGWSAIPEFSSNLVDNAWATVPGFLNSFSNGTNTTTFDRLDPICGPNVFLRVRNQKN